MRGSNGVTFVNCACTCGEFLPHSFHSSCSLVCFRLLSKIGEGHFASVFLGSWFSGKGRLTQVAVKQLKPTASAEWRVKFLQEAAIMGQFHHQNIVKMFGVVQVDGEEDNCVSGEWTCGMCIIF